MKVMVDYAEEQTEPLYILLARKLKGFDVVSPQELEALRHAIKDTEAFRVGQDLVTAEDRPSYSSLLIKGWAARSKTLEDGSRQITSVHVPGDFVDLHSFLLHKMDHSVVALSPCRIATMPHDRLHEISENHPHLTRLLWLNSLVDAAIHRNWIVAMGRLPAIARLTQFICEIYVRLEAVGLAKDHTFEFPLTQPVVADVLGISVIHVARTLREIREKNLISWRARTVKIPDWERLAEVAQFEPTYLSLRSEPR